jgi:hypothetical protein
MLLRGLALVAFLCAPLLVVRGAEVWWSPEVTKALDKAGGNRPELEKALEKVDTKCRPGMAFLITYMPENDLKVLNSKYLLDNVALSYEARAKFAWGKNVPEDLFLNDVLPYA